ncbi:MAG: hypothetical protein KF852_09460 [Saprospiraceae bacterium]|nr:hypothetical protein [Saprospiraceae bacterium]
MKNANLNIDLEQLIELAKDCKHQLELQVLEKCPFIVQVGELTIATDETGKVVVENVNYPTQFTRKAVDEILKMTFRNGNDDVVKPKIYTRVEWYRERLNKLTETIEFLKSSPSEVI